jgi:hypothetical protein
MFLVLRTCVAITRENPLVGEPVRSGSGGVVVVYELEIEHYLREAHASWI